jgi:hypothetical protein
VGVSSSRVAAAARVAGALTRSVGSESICATEGGGAARSPEERFVQAGLRRRRIQRGTLAGITGCIFAVLSGFLWYAVVQKQEAELAQQEAKEQAAETRDALRISAVHRMREDGSTVHTGVGLLREVEAEDPARIRG